MLIRLESDPELERFGFVTNKEQSTTTSCSNNSIESSLSSENNPKTLDPFSNIEIATKFLIDELYSNGIQVLFYSTIFIIIKMYLVCRRNFIRTIH